MNSITTTDTLFLFVSSANCCVYIATAKDIACGDARSATRHFPCSGRFLNAASTPLYLDAHTLACFCEVPASSGKRSARPREVHVSTLCPQCRRMMIYSVRSPGGSYHDYGPSRGEGINCQRGSPQLTSSTGFQSDKYLPPFIDLPQHI